MEILEYFEKNSRIKNKKIELKYNIFYMKKLYEILDFTLENIKTDIQNDNKLSICSKKEIENKNIITNIMNTISENLEQKKESFIITYENIELLNYEVCQRIIKLNDQKEKWGKTLNEVIENEYQIACNIRLIYIDKYNEAMERLYLKRKVIDTELIDYIEECKYNNFFIESPIHFKLHISAKEKNNILTILNKKILDAEDNLLKPIAINSECDELKILISIDEIKATSQKILKELEKEINTGNCVNINIKDYFILKHIII